MPTKKKPTPAQLAARKKFVEMVRAKAKAKKATTKKASTHKDTKSHNVNVKVVSGLDSVKRRGNKTQVNYSRMSGIEKVIFKNTRNYLALYDFGHDISTAVFQSTSLDEAKRLAQMHKRHTPELKKSRVTVKLMKKQTL